MQGSYEVVVPALVQHAKTLGGLEAELRSASDTAKAATVTDSAYGELCADFPGILRRLAQAGQTTLQKTAEALDEAVTDMRDTARTYSDEEDHAEARFS